MNVSLTSKMKVFIQEQIDKGRYFSPSEVVNEALELLEEREQIRHIKLEKIRQQVKLGIEEAERGEVFDGREVIKELYQKIELISQENK